MSSAIAFKDITIIGVGLIGGSFALALKKIKSNSISITGFGRNKEKLKEAKERGIIDSYTTDLLHAVKEKDLIVLATPVNKFKEIIQKIKEIIKKRCIIMDVGSIKGMLVREIEEMLPEDVYFIGAHPIAGSEKSGFKYAKSDMFKGVLCILTPTEKTNKEAFKKVKNMWQCIGAEVKELSPEEHDKIYAVVSHLPHMVAYALVNTVRKISSEYLYFAGRGFMDITRLAKSSPLLWSGICVENKKNLIRIIDDFKKELDDISKAIINDDMEKLEELFNKAAELRKKADEY